MMAAYVVCHFERHKGLDTMGVRELLGHQILKRWSGTLQLDGSWIIQAEATSEDIRDELLPIIPEGHSLIVIGAGNDAAWAGFQDAEADWLVENI